MRLNARLVAALLCLALGVASILGLARKLSQIFAEKDLELAAGIEVLALIILGGAFLIGQRLLASFARTKISSFGKQNAADFLAQYSRRKQINTDKLISSMTNELGRAQGLFGNTASQVISGIFLAIGATLYMAWNENRAFFLILSLLLAVVFAVNKFQRRKARDYGRINRENFGRSSQAAVSIVQRVESVLASGKDSLLVNEYAYRLGDWLSSILDLWFLSAAGKYLVESIAVIIFVTSFVLLDSRETIEAFVVLARLLPSVTAAQRFANGFSSNSSLFTRILGYRERPISSQRSIQHIVIDPARELQPQLDEALNSTDTKFLVLTGKSGTGKSTALKQLAHDRGLTTSYLSPELCDDLILSLVVSHCTQELSRLVSESNLAAALVDFDFRKPSLLSTGQRQRLLLLASICGDYDTLVLDEALSGVDTENLEICIDLILRHTKIEKFVIVDHSGKIQMRLQKIAVPFLLIEA